MNLNNLAGEKSEVRIQHASIASGNLALIESAKNGNKNKQLLKKKKIRPHPENINKNQNVEKKPNTNEENEKKGLQKSDKSNIFNFNYIWKNI